MGDEWDDDESWGEVTTPAVKSLASPDGTGTKSQNDTEDGSYVKLTPPMGQTPPKREEKEDAGPKIVENRIHSLKDLQMKGQNDINKLAEMTIEKLNAATSNGAWPKCLNQIYEKAVGNLSVQECEKLNTLISTMAKQKKKKIEEDANKARIEAAREEEEKKKKELEEAGEEADEDFYADLM